MTTIVSDSFTDTATTALASHTGETGATWTKHGINASGTAEISNANRLRGTSAGASLVLHYASGVPGSADYYVEASIKFLSMLSGTYAGVAGRINTAANTFYWAIYNVSSASWELWNATTKIGSFAYIASAGEEHTLRLDMAGTTIRLLVNGAEAVSVTDATISAAGRAGVLSYGVTSDSTGLHHSSFAAADAGGAVLTSGDPSVTSYGLTIATVTSSAASGGTSPYTYQWQRSTTSGSGFSDVSGATSLTLNDTGLTRGTTYYYRLVSTDSAAASVTSSEVSLTTRSKQVVCDGDSITAGQGLSAANKYPAQMQALLGNTWQIDNTGVSGQTVAQMQSTRTDVDAFYSGSNTRNVVVCGGGTNDLYFNASAATLETRIQDYCASCKSQGFEVYVWTLLPRGDFPGTSTLPGADAAAQETEFEVRRTAYNTWLRSSYASFADGICDLAADSTIGEDGDEDSATYYQDTVHPTTAGATIIAGIVAPVVLAGPNTVTLTKLERGRTRGLHRGLAIGA